MVASNSTIEAPIIEFVTPNIETRDSIIEIVTPKTIIEALMIEFVTLNIETGALIIEIVTAI